MRQERVLAGVDKLVSPIALGTAHFNRAQESLWKGLLDAYVQRGGTTIDTGHIYGDSERIIGEWLGARGNRDGLVICTKGGHGDNILPREGWREMLDAELPESLDRLDVDAIDMYWLHRDNPAVPVGPIIECLNGYLERGWIRAFGGSNWTLPRVIEAETYAASHGLKGFAGVSNNLSLAVQAEPFYPGLVSCDEAEAQWHLETGKPLFAWSSQARGFFTGAYGVELRTNRERIADGFLRRMGEVYCTEENFERLARAQKLAKEKGDYTAVQIALSWLLHHSVQVIPIVGPRNPDELASCFDALSIEMTEDEHRWLNLE